MFIFNENELVDNIQVRLHILEVSFAKALEKHNRNLLTCNQVVRTNDFDYFCSYSFVAVVNEFFNEIKVY